MLKFYSLNWADLLIENSQEKSGEIRISKLKIVCQTSKPWKKQKTHKNILSL